MCGRYALHTSGDRLASRFALARAPAVQPSYNVAPGARAPAIAWSREARPRLLAPSMSWGFPTAGPRRPHNARAETAHEKPPFRPAWRTRRCAVPFDAFFEWDTRKQPREPWCFAPADGPLAFAGLYWPLDDPARSGEYGFALLTTDANRDVASVHQRMPVILQPDEVAEFADPETPAERLRELSRTPPADLLTARRAPAEIARTDVDGPWLLGAGRNVASGW